MRIVLLLVVLGGLALLLAQNWAPVLPLVFLGFQTPALPMAAWILIALAAGAITSLLISSLFKLANLFTRPSPSKRRQKSPIPPPRPSDQRSEAFKTVVIPSPPNTTSTSTDVSNDWDSNSTADDDWDFGEDTDKTPNFGSQTTVRDSTTFESSQTTLRDSTTSQASPQPKSSYPADSVYSYSYQEPRNSSVGKTESVYDADYRVIKPPDQQPDPAEEDDWRFSDQRSQAPKTVASPSQPDSGSTPNNSLDDWDLDPTTNDDDWDFEEDTGKTPSYGSQNTPINSRIYEVTAEPKSSQRSGSVYSYSYRESKNSGTSKAELAYDAGDRVIKQPAQKTDPIPDDEDWGFEDEDFEDEGESDSPR